ncbi:MAG: hypothetical protein ABIF92_00225 [archaeon]
MKKPKFSKKTRDILETLAYILVGYLIAIGANKGMGYALDTDYPVVAVVSSSMEHHTDMTYRDWFRARNFNQTQMEEWSFQHGMNKGDIVFVKGGPMKK